MPSLGHMGRGPLHHKICANMHSISTNISLLMSVYNCPGAIIQKYFALLRADIMATIQPQLFSAVESSDPINFQKISKLRNMLLDTVAVIANERYSAARANYTAELANDLYLTLQFLNAKYLQLYSYYRGDNVQQLIFNFYHILQLRDNVNHIDRVLASLLLGGRNRIQIHHIDVSLPHIHNITKISAAAAYNAEYPPPNMTLCTKVQVEKCNIFKLQKIYPQPNICGGVGDNRCNNNRNNNKRGDKNVDTVIYTPPKTCNKCGHCGSGFASCIFLDTRANNDIVTADCAGKLSVFRRDFSDYNVFATIDTDHPGKIRALLVVDEKNIFVTCCDEYLKIWSSEPTIPSNFVASHTTTISLLRCVDRIGLCGKNTMFGVWVYTRVTAMILLLDRQRIAVATNMGEILVFDISNCEDITTTIPVVILKTRFGGSHLACLTNGQIISAPMGACEFGTGLVARAAEFINFWCPINLRLIFKLRIYEYPTFGIRVLSDNTIVGGSKLGAIFLWRPNGVVDKFYVKKSKNKQIVAMCVMAKTDFLLVGSGRSTHVYDPNDLSSFSIKTDRHVVVLNPIRTIFCGGWVDSLVEISGGFVSGSRQIKKTWRTCSLVEDCCIDTAADKTKNTCHNPISNEKNNHTKTNIAILRCIERNTQTAIACPLGVWIS